MTDFTEKMIVRELIDVSAYIASRRPKGAPKTVSAQGQVVAVILENDEIVLTHGEIKGFMDAMTMGYKVASPGLLKGIRPGDKVQFTIDTDKSRSGLAFIGFAAIAVFFLREDIRHICLAPCPFIQ